MGIDDRRLDATRGRCRCRTVIGMSTDAYRIDMLENLSTNGMQAARGFEASQELEYQRGRMASRQSERFRRDENYLVIKQPEIV